MLTSMYKACCVAGVHHFEDLEHDPGCCFLRYGSLLLQVGTGQRLLLGQDYRQQSSTTRIHETDLHEPLKVPAGA